MQNRNLLLLATAAITLTGFTAINTPTTADAATMTGNLTYHKAKVVAKIGSHYQQFKLTNHVINSDYQHIKTTSWKKSGLKKVPKLSLICMLTKGCNLIGTEFQNMLPRKALTPNLKSKNIGFMVKH
ncbi:hypothetical protein [Lentilactobacillus dabitei]|uniref:hypothetical protein n=1 Tax=Lentilactobacillus dabitei TaxID=2831523 RepID=UPI00201C057E|nr:hypothetical protein [Lentilactobacillus dabitei]